MAKKIKIKKDQFIVQSKVKEAFKNAGLRVGGDFTDNLNTFIAGELEKAAVRCTSNGRQTVKGTDI